jgi:ATP-dependent RNA helicase RhlE
MTPTKESTGFAALPLIEQLHRALAHEGYITPTPIQAQAIPPLLQGRDILGVAQTGTGKTAAFVLPLLQHLTQQKRMPSRGRPRALILAPTRELAAQIGESITAYGRFLHITHTVIFGGVGQQPQVDALGRGMDIVVATPGRLLDLMQQGFVRLDGVEVFVLDEADRMLDMGFIHDIRKIVPKLPQQRQSLFFSATMAPDVVALARTMVRDPVHVTIAPEQPTVERIAQKVLFVEKKDKDALLIDILLDRRLHKIIIFTQMKHVANKVAEKLNKAGITAAAIHGNKSQTARTQALAGFKSGKVRALVATDIAARGIDVDGITHVINYDLPNEPETYVHRIGRTARAGADGDAISFCAPDERDYLRDIERLIRKQIPVDDKHRFHSENARNATGAAARPPPKQQWGGRRRDDNGDGTGRGSRPYGGPRPQHAGPRRFHRR